MPNEPYVEEIMVADGDGDHPEVEEVKYENTQVSDDVIGVKGNDETSYRNGYVNITQDDIVGNDDEDDVSDSDLIIFKKTSDSKWYRKAFSKIWDYIKSKIGISVQGSTGKYLNEQGSWSTPPNTTYDAMSSSELSTGTETTLRTMRADYAKDGIKQLMLDMCYPVGSIYISTKNVSPATFLGGTWIQHNDYTLYATNSSTAVKFNTAAKDGGANSVTLTGAQSGLKGHGHGFTQPTVNGGATNTGGMSANNPHTHTQNAHDHSSSATVYTGVGAYGHTGHVSITDNNSVEKTYKITAGSATATNQNKDIAHTHSQVAHTHSVSGGKVTDASASNATSAHNTIPNYKFVYMWERTA